MNKRLFLITIMLVFSIFAEYILTKDRTPGGLYVVGPDISPDSLEGEYLYYSPDAGTTLVVKDSSGYTAIATDYTTGNVYKKALENLYHSSDYGSTWTLRVTHVGYNDMLSSGYSDPDFALRI